MTIYQNSPILVYEPNNNGTPKTASFMRSSGSFHTPRSSVHSFHTASSKRKHTKSRKHRKHKKRGTRKH